MKRLGLRMRLTLIYGGLFFVAGSALLWITYLLTARSLDAKFVKVLGAGPPPSASAQPKEAVFFQAQVQAQAEVGQRADKALNEILQWSVSAMVMIGLAAVVIGYLVADRALKPLNRVTETAQRLSESTLHERIALEGPPDEVKRLADTFDAMLGRLHRVFDAQRRFIANASHELRTPLAINRTVLEVSLEEPEASPDLKALARALLGTNARYERLIEGLLLLAQSEQELTTRKPVQLERVIRTALELTPAKRGVTIHEDLRPAVAEGDPLFLERCVFNLVENAIKYNVRDGQVWITLRESYGGGGIITVENTGPVVSPFEVDDLFEPFRRNGDRVQSGRGAGLGLSIVRAITEAHGGTVTAKPRAEGGLSVALRLPA
ncbi:sensor histidine kinase [Nonomuraea endophytica]|uniref:histidine kinase n=1 Tax=Nonomuraea endophytica TaxID=714136 RepID=A0A7W8EK27_9ACTN|nr:HAMP domain-containing sensor histidine kinase [Nonomuraea endophytica]MBB5082166.1 signal transduction histidine kinase [Nonomuraea endophytica]